jgi:nucleotidyltransferase/DNA polymerase involved in DNA repair
MRWNAEYSRMQLARLFSRKGGRSRDDRISRPFDWEELERLTAHLGMLHGRLETAQAIGHFGTVNTVKRDLKRVWTERERMIDRLLNQVVEQAVV